MPKIEVSAELNIRDVESGAAMVLRLDGLRGPTSLGEMGVYLGRLVQEKLDALLQLDTSKEEVKRLRAELAAIGEVPAPSQLHPEPPVNAPVRKPRPKYKAS